MRVLRLLAPRLIAFVLALIMVIGLFPVLPQPAYAEDLALSLAKDVADGKEVPVGFGYTDTDYPDIEASNGVKITGGVSEITDKSNGESTVSFCLDQGNPAPIGHYDEMVAKANENLKNNPLLLSTFFFGYDNNQKNHAQVMEGIMAKWLNKIPELQGHSLDYLSEMQLPAGKADMIYERATQYAIWIAAHIDWNAKDRSDQRFGIEGTWAFMNGSGLQDISEPYGGNTSKPRYAKSYVKMGGNNNLDTTNAQRHSFTAQEKQMVLKMAKQLITLGSWMAYKGWSPIEMEPELKIYPVAIGDNVPDGRTGLDQFYNAGSFTFDFSN